MMRYRAATSGHHYNIEFSGVGAPLILLHGFSGDSTTWKGIASHLKDSFQLIAIDVLGHGASDKPAQPASYRIEAVAADLIDLLDQLGLAQAHLLGYSMGGRLALALALRQPERFRSLVLESASPGLADAAERAQRWRRDDALADDIEAQGILWFINYWEHLPLWASQSQLPAAKLAAQRSQRLRNSTLGLANSLRGMGSGAQPNLWSELPDLRIPTLLLVGDKDEKFLKINNQMAQLIPLSRVALLPSAGHNTHLENPCAFSGAVSSFLQSV